MQVNKNNKKLATYMYSQWVVVARDANRTETWSVSLTQDLIQMWPDLIKLEGCTETCKSYAAILGPGKDIYDHTTHH